MKSLMQSAIAIVQEPKTGVAVGAGTFATGMANWMECIPNDIGKLVSLIGILVSVIMLIYHVRKDRREERMSRIRYRVKQEELRKLKKENGVHS